MHIIVFLYKKTRGNTFGSIVQETYTNFRACFDLRPVPRIFTKLLKISNANLRRINIMIIYLNDRLLMCHSMKEISTCRYTVMFWLKHLGFLINWKKCFDSSVGDRTFGAKN